MNLLLLLACAGEADDSTATTTPDETLACPRDAYAVDWHTEPEELSAGETGELWLTVTDGEGNAISDLQETHERMVHTFVISEDLASFQHVHHEDYQDRTADDLRTGTFHYPLSVPSSGAYRLSFDYAHCNQYLATLDWMEVAGSPAQASEPDLTESTTATDGTVTGEFSWQAEAIAGYEAIFNVHLTEDGADVTDLVQYLGADAHAAVASADLETVGHTHAWYPGMDGVPPGHVMEHFYVGPDLPFHYTFPSAGAYKIWVQLTRASDPSRVYVLPYVVEVLP